MSTQPTYTPASQPKRWAVLLLTIVLAVAAVLTPTVAEVETLAHERTSTHLLALARSNAPWNAIIFLAVPALILATLAATEFIILMDGARKQSWARTANSVAGVLAGPVMLALAVHVVAHEFVPHHHDTRAVVDLVASVLYVLLAIPMIIVTLTELRMIGKDRRDVRRLHAMWSGIGLVLGAVTLLVAVLPI